MRLLQFFLFGLLILLSKPCFAAGFKPLFNGKDFTGWFLKLNSGDSALISKTYGVDVDSGWVHVMKNLPDNYNANTTNNLLGMMFTKDKYSQYVLRWEYKWGTKIMNKDGVFKDYQYDAGVYYHNTNDWIFPTGLEYQIRFDHTKNQNYTGDIITTKVVCDWFKKPNDWRFSLPEVGGIAERSKENWGLKGGEAPFNGLNDKWNKCELIVMGRQYALYKLNGKIVNYITNLSVGEGTFGFQAESAEIFYRNIEIMVTDTIIPFSITKQDNFAPTGVKENRRHTKATGTGVSVVAVAPGPGFVHMFNPTGEKVKAIITNAQGQQISNDEINPRSGKKLSLAKGFYSLRISIGKTYTIENLVISQ